MVILWFKATRSFRMKKESLREAHQHFIKQFQIFNEFLVETMMWIIDIADSFRTTDEDKNLVNVDENVQLINLLSSQCEATQKSSLRAYWFYFVTLEHNDNVLDSFQTLVDQITINLNKNSMRN